MSRHCHYKGGKCEASELSAQVQKGDDVITVQLLDREEVVRTVERRPFELKVVVVGG